MNKKRKGRALRWLGKSPDSVFSKLHDQAMKHNRGFFHQTILRYLAKILRPEKIGEDRKYLFKLSSLEALNDTTERTIGVHAYVLSLSYGPEENVSMWTTYGVPRREAIRLRFPSGAIRRWCEEAEKQPASVCFIKNSAKDKAFHSIVPSRIRFADVLYVVRKGMPGDYLAEHDGKMHKSPDKKCWTVFAKTAPDVGLGLFMKNRGWAYERESRIVVEFDKRPTGKIDGSIYIDFTSVVQAMLENKGKSGRSNILLGPWFDEALFRRNITGKHSSDDDDWSSLSAVIDRSNKSSYTGELRMLSNCDHCKANKKTCKCEFKERSKRKGSRGIS